MMEQLQFDLNLVKKESQYFEDYGQNAGNILDNIIPEPEFDHFGQAASNVPNAEDLDHGVDWLNSFFDEPAHDTCNINGLNPPISKLSDMPLGLSAAYPSMVKVLSSNGQSNACSVEALSLLADEYANDIVLKSPNKPTTPDPFLGTPDHKVTQPKANTESSLPQILKKGSNFKVLTQLDKNTLNLATARDLIQRLKTETQLHDAAHRVPDQKSQRTLTRRFGGQIVKTEHETSDQDSGSHSLLSGISRTVPELSSLQNGRPLCYDSPSQRSPDCAPASPTHFSADKECSNSTNSDQSQERQTFYLSEEERRTLITEGLPVPMGYPLSKVEERALKKVRRKIKNKISAQESRRKKKEYMEALEKKIEIMNGDNNNLKKKVDTLENTNRSLLSQLQKLQAMVTSKTSSRDLTTRSCQTAAN